MSESPTKEGALLGGLVRWFRWAFIDDHSVPVAQPAPEVAATPWRKPSRFVLFLDFDGVCHPGFSETFIHLPKLEEVLRQYPFVDIVISSSWRENSSPEYLLKIFSADIAPRVAGVTPQLRGEHVRALEIDRYCAMNGVTNRLILDDSRNLFFEGHPDLLITESNIGLQDSHLAEIRSIFDGWAEQGGV